MKKVLATIVFLFTIASANAQSPIYAVWDYPDAEIAEIVGFQVKFDSGAYQPIVMPAPETLPDTMIGHKSFRYAIPSTFTNGQHSVAVRACNSTECSWDATAVFKLIGPPKNPRVQKGG